ncbi:unnamed protein product, partial [Mesorhabditis belari]|uniref:Apple domain-containing protein n=1 Tax=Mesorhabditis belari TaxID=2138241 RepID=A0AAF3E8N1_9BILA
MSIKFILLCLHLVLGDYLDVNQCFSQRPGYEVSVRVNEVKTTAVVEMKDECLRACLRTLIEPGERCLSIMHMPRDNNCIISNAIGQNIAKADDTTKKHTNYYENECAKPPVGGQVEARLSGYRGAEGVLQMAQKHGDKAKIMVVMTGLAAGRDYSIYYAPELSKEQCRKVHTIHNAKVGERLVIVDSDHSGMGIQPWTEINWEILDDDVLNKVLVVAETNSGLVVDCGEIKLRGNR